MVRRWWWECNMAKQGNFGIVGRLVATMAFMLIVGSWSFGQSADEVLDYMLENRVGFFEATDVLGIDSGDAASELGYDNLFTGMNRANRETSLLFAECWGVFVYVQGTAEEEIGLDHEELSEYFALRMANDASFLPECEDEFDGTAILFDMRVWTVGDNYPVAHYLQVTGSLVPNIEGGPDRAIDSEWLGYGSAENIPDGVRDTIDEAVENFALRYLRVQRLR